MIIFLTIIHVIVSVFMIAVILLQQGKSADLAGAFGGQGSQTAFGPRGAANMLTRLTTWSAIIFMVTSISLFVLIGKHAGGGSVLEGTPTAPVHPAGARAAREEVDQRIPGEGGRQSSAAFLFLLNSIPCLHLDQSPLQAKKMH